MGRYIQKCSGLEVEAIQWWKNGDHPKDECKTVMIPMSDTDGYRLRLSEGKVVRRYRKPEINGCGLCGYCGLLFENHGWIDQGLASYTVCPGNFVINVVGTNNYFVVAKKRFEAEFEPLTVTYDDHYKFIRDQDPKCQYADKGRGDCYHFVGVPKEFNVTTTDVYGKPHGWCWFCWLSYQNSALRDKLNELNRWKSDIYQDTCEGAYVPTSLLDATRQALYEVAPDHPVLKGDPPSYGVWEKLRKDLDRTVKERDDVLLYIKDIAGKLSTIEFGYFENIASLKAYVKSCVDSCFECRSSSVDE